MAAKSKAAGTATSKAAGAAGKKKCNPAKSYNCGKACIKLSFTCHKDGPAGKKAQAVANELEAALSAAGGAAGAASTSASSSASAGKPAGAASKKCNPEKSYLCGKACISNSKNCKKDPNAKPNVPTQDVATTNTAIINLLNKPIEELEAELEAANKKTNESVAKVLGDDELQGVDEEDLDLQLNFDATPTTLELKDLPEVVALNNTLMDPNSSKKQKEDAHDELVNMLLAKVAAKFDSELNIDVQYTADQTNTYATKDYEKLFASDASKTFAPNQFNKEIVSLLSTGKTSNDAKVASEARRYFASETKFDKSGKTKEKSDRIQANVSGITKDEADALALYIGSGYGGQTKALRTGLTSASAAGYSAVLAASATHKIPTPTEAQMRQVTPDWRDTQKLRRDIFIPDSAMEDFLSTYKNAAGSNLVETSFMSTTMNQGGEEYFAESSNVRYEISRKTDGTSAGKLVDPYKNGANEGEILFPPLSEFKVNSVSKDEFGTYVIDLTEV